MSLLVSKHNKLSDENLKSAKVSHKKMAKKEGCNIVIKGKAYFYDYVIDKPLEAFGKLSLKKSRAENKVTVRGKLKLKDSSITGPITLTGKSLKLIKSNCSSLFIKKNSKIKTRSWPMTMFLPEKEESIEKTVIEIDKDSSIDGTIKVEKQALVEIRYSGNKPDVDGEVTFNEVSSSQE